MTAAPAPGPAATPGLGLPAVLAAPAKLTFSLRVTGVRPDGYHLLDAEMVTLDLADTVALAEGEGCTASAEGPCGSPVLAGRSVPVGPDNLACRALAAVGRTAALHLVKRIPPGAGLGGGSADAAAVLRWAGCTDPAVAAGLGADVPFCVAGGRARVRGVGEVVAPLPFEDRAVTLLLLPFGVDTAAVYRAWDELVARGRIPAPVPPPAGGPPTSAASTRPGTPAPASGNDLEMPALAVAPRMARWRDLLEAVAGRPARLAGSGSTWFVEGAIDGVAGTAGRVLRLGDEAGVLVGVRTTPAVGAGS